MKIDIVLDKLFMGLIYVAITLTFSLGLVACSFHGSASVSSNDSGEQVTCTSLVDGSVIKSPIAERWYYEDTGSYRSFDSLMHMIPRRGDVCRNSEVMRKQ